MFVIHKRIFEIKIIFFGAKMLKIPEVELKFGNAEEIGKKIYIVQKFGIISIIQVAVNHKLSRISVGNFFLFQQNFFKNS